MISKVKKVLTGYQFDLSSEKYLQEQIQDVFSENQIESKPEFKLAEADIVDFFIDGLAVEVKIKGQAKQIYRQCERYLKHDKVTSLLLVTNRSMGFPETINGKPCFVINLGTAWL